MSNGSSFSDLTAADPFLVKHTGERVVVGITCCLSILGSVLIVLSYVFIKSVRSRTREILVHLSLMDLGVALTNLIGDAVYFDQYLYNPSPNDSSVETINDLCKTQAFFAAYFTYGSILWTVSLAVYLYFLILYQGTKLAVYFLRFSYAFCYVLPFFVSMWLVLTGRLGYAPYDSTGWCSLVLKDPHSGKVDFFIAIFGSDLWFYLAILLIVLLYLAVRVQASDQLRAVGSPTRIRNSVDYKFLLIPVCFVVLRMWTCIVNILYVYAQLDPSDVPTVLDKILVYLAGIGDSGQGFANAILFVLLTKKVRQHFIKFLRCRKVHPAAAGGEEGALVETSGTDLKAGKTSDSNLLLHHSLEASYCDIQLPGNYGTS